MLGNDTPVLEKDWDPPMTRTQFNAAVSKAATRLRRDSVKSHKIRIQDCSKKGRMKSIKCPVCGTMFVSCLARADGICEVKGCPTKTPTK